MTFYGRMAATADRLLDLYGQQVTFVRTPKTIDPMDGKVTPGTALTSTVPAVVLPASKGTIQAFDNRLEDSSLAGKKLRYLKVAAKDMTFEPKSLDMLILGGQTWQVLGCTPVNPAGTPLVYGVGVVQL